MHHTSISITNKKKRADYGCYFSACEKKNKKNLGWQTITLARNCSIGEQSSLLHYLVERSLNW